MWIERLQVEEGFLDGLDVTFSAGLNVIVGARGVGKTSVLELIRYALRLPHVDERKASGARQHADAILSGGRVLVTYVEGDQRVTVSRSSSDAESANTAPAVDDMPMMLGQNELEGIGLDPRSRLRLVDAHAGLNVVGAEQVITRVSAQVQSLTTRMHSLALEREGMRQQELVRPSVERELAEARVEEAALLAQAGSDAAELRQRLGDATNHIAELRRSISDTEAFGEVVRALESRAVDLVTTLQQTVTDIQSGRLSETGFESEVMNVLVQQETVVTALRVLQGRLNEAVSLKQETAARADQEMRPLRRDFDAYQIGAAAAAQRTARLERQLMDIDEASHRAAVLDTRMADLVKQREVLMREIDNTRETLWARRTEAAAQLNEKFQPRIRVALEHYGDRAEYVNALSAALRGSGLQHKQLAEWLTERVSPQELVTSVEDGDAGRLALMGEITSARVEKLVAHLANTELLGDVLTARIEDLADILLLVGRDYRNSEQLSTGQRCSVVLPLLLADPTRVLLLDQPEDHLDNAYLVENTVRTLLARSKYAQTIIATHNANIPVLGNADLVIALDSDGRRGYVKNKGELLAPPIVGTISELMEGGREAFARRANFYRSGSGRS